MADTEHIRVDPSVQMHLRLRHILSALVAASCAAPTAAGDRPQGPTAVRAGETAYASLAAGFVHTCALDAEGSASCWGNNDYGQLGGSSDERCGGRPCATRPIAVRGALRFTRVAAGWVHNCGVTAGGAAWCWGGGADAHRGYLGDGTIRQSLEPVRVLTDSQLVSVTAGDGHTCGLTASGTALCWGENDLGQVGDGTRVDRLVPTVAGGGRRFRALAAGAYHTCGIDRDGVAWCWGDNRWGQLGAGEVPYNAVDHWRPAPVAVLSQVPFVGIVAGWEHTCALAGDGAAFCWGRNEIARQLGDGSDATHRGVPVRVATNEAFARLAAGALASCGLTAAGDTFCWGANYHGALGDGTSSATGVGRPVRGRGGPWHAVALGQAHACGIGAGRELSCWGDRSAGQY